MAVDPPDVPEKGEEKKGEEEHAASSTSPPLSGSRSAAEIKAVARKYANCPLQNPDPGVWAVLTAISQQARQRPQGMNIILKREEHYIGRSAEDSFRISDHAISARHCKIYRRKKVVGDDQVADTPVPVFLKDSSMNGTFLNWERLSRSSPASRVQHGDIISFLGTPDSERAYAFVYREASHSARSKNSSLKRKSEEQSAPESKRVKGLGIGAPDGPISLDDVRSLQRSNTELRKQLESHVLTIENMQSEALISAIRHENEIKELKDSISNSFIDQIKELQHILKVKRKELDDANAVSAECRDLIKDLNERLHSSMQSRAEADEIINSQKAIISERAVQIDEERNLRRVEREKAAADLKSALQRAHLEAQEEIERQADIHLQQQREQQEFILKLQESEKEGRLLGETLRSKLEDTRESLVTSEKKVRQVEAQLQEEQIASESNRKRSEMLELDIKKLKKDLENEKVAREEAWAKVSALELEIAAVIRELSIEKRRFQGARERIILRESQLRAFYSTTEEISALFARQQEQLKAMQKTLEDEDNYDNRSTGFDLNAMAYEDDAQAFTRVQREGGPSGQPRVDATAKDGEARMVHTVDDRSSNDDASVTEKHECGAGSPEDGENTQDLEGTSADRSAAKGFGSDIDGAGTTAPEGDGEGHAGETEGVPETESQGLDAGLDGQVAAAAALQRCSNLAGDTIQLEDATQVQENAPRAGTCDGENDHDHGSESRIDDTETGTVKTADLLASEGLGSWANSTAPSVHGENDTPGYGANADVDVGAAAAALCSFDAQAAGSQSSNAAVVSGVTRLTDQHRALNALLEIVAPDFEKRFPGSVLSGAGEEDALTDAETEEDSGDDEEGDDGEEKSRSGDDDAMIEDSIG